ncbi:hypothetical protein JST97_21555 [bacterium]|nr:hypothetical protein [bacterium]
MALRKLAAFCAWFCLTPTILAQPQPPAQPPASLPLPLRVQIPETGLAQRYDLKAGWNAISFPFRKVVSFSGLDSLVDPDTGKTLSPLDQKPGKAYWTYARSDCQGWAWGETVESGCIIELNKGWNLVGSPDSQALLLGQATASDESESNRIWEEICPDWIDSKMIANGKIVPLGAGTEWEPGAAYWVFARRPLKLRINSPGDIPVVQSLTLNDKQEQVLEGSHFGTLAQGRLLVGGQEIPASSIQEWTDRRIRFLMPSGLTGDSVILIADGAATPRVPVKAAGVAAWTASPGTRVPFTLKVVSQDNQPIARAQAWVDSKYAGLTDRYGLIYINQLTPGTHKVSVRCRDFLPLDLAWTVAGSSSHPTAKMYAPRSQINVRVMDPQDGFRLYKVDVYAVNDFTQRYTKYYTYDQATPYIDIFWTNITGNINYRFDLIWRNGDGREKYQTVYRTPGRYGIKETWWNYWTYY